MKTAPDGHGHRILGVRDGDGELDRHARTQPHTRLFDESLDDEALHIVPGRRDRGDEDDVSVHLPVLDGLGGKLHGLPGGEFGHVHLVHMRLDEELGKVGNRHQRGSAVHARRGDHDLPLDDGHGQHRPVSGRENLGLGEFVLDDLLFPLGLGEAVLRKVEIRLQVVECLPADQLLAGEFPGALKIPLRFAHHEFRSFDFGDRGFEFAENVAIVNLDEELPRLHFVARFDVEGLDTTADLALHVKLGGGLNIAAHLHGKIDVPHLDQRGRWRRSARCGILRLKDTEPFLRAPIVASSGKSSDEEEEKKLLHFDRKSGWGNRNGVHGRRTRFLTTTTAGTHGT